MKSDRIHGDKLCTTMNMLQHICAAVCVFGLFSSALGAQEEGSRRDSGAIVLLSVQADNLALSKAVENEGTWVSCQLSEDGGSPQAGEFSIMSAANSPVIRIRRVAGGQPEPDHALPASFVMESRTVGSGLLSRMVAAELATAFQLTVPTVKPAALRINGRPRGVFALMEADCPPKTSSDSSMTLPWADEAIVAESPGKKTDSSDTKALLRRQFQDFLSSTNLDALIPRFDLDTLYRLWAWESFTRASDGYLQTGSNCQVRATRDFGRISWLPGRATRFFCASDFSVLARHRGRLTQHLASWPLPRSNIVELVEAVVTVPQKEQDLISAVRTTAASVRRHLPGHEVSNWDGETESLIAAIERRFRCVRAEISRWRALTASQRAKQTLPIISTQSSGNPVKAVTASYLQFAQQLLARDDRKPARPGGSGPTILQLKLMVHTNLDRISMDDANWHAADGSLNGALLQEARIRLKGSGTRSDFLGKPSFTMKFAANPAFQQNTKLHFHNARHDASYLREYLSYLLFSRMGIACPSIGLATVAMNGVDYGVFVVEEGTTEQFLARSFGDGTGILMEGQFRDINGDLDPDSKNQGRLPARLVELYNRAQQGKLDASPEDGKGVFPPAHLASYLAVENLLGLRDGYCFNVNNYRIYASPANLTLHLIPHGMDGAAELREANVFPNVEGVLALAVLADPAHRQKYLAEIERLVAETSGWDRILDDLSCANRSVQSLLHQTDPMVQPRQRIEAATVIAALLERRDSLGRLIKEAR